MKLCVKRNQVIVLNLLFLSGLALRGLDILGAAKTGSGKTLAFIIPIIGNLNCLLKEVVCQFTQKH